MNETLLQFNINFIQFVIGLIVFIGAIGITWGALRTKVFHLEKDIDRLDNGFKELRNEMINNFKDLRVEIGNSFEELRESVSSIRSVVIGKDASPMVPNEKGWEAINGSHWPEIYPKVKKQIFEEMVKVNPTNLYDVEKTARSVLFNLKNTDEFLPLKNYVVHNPEITLDTLLVGISWLIRDNYAADKNIK